MDNDGRSVNPLGYASSGIGKAARLGRKLLSYMVSVLCVQRRSIYKTMGLDCYDEDRDMRTFTGENAVVCHPPCAQWSAMRHLANDNPAVKALALDCIEIIRKNGGVLEH